ncbi:hypothetical protein BGZ65_000793, partial [Modicella reniformis]
MTTLASFRSTLAAHPLPATANTLKTILSTASNSTKRFIAPFSSSTTASAAAFARPCSIITPATTIRYRQETSHHNNKQQHRAFSLFGNPKSDTKLLPKAVQNETPEALMHQVHPLPMREEFMGKKRLSTKDLEAIPVDLGFHREPANISDWVAYHVVKSLRFPVDLFFRTKYIHRVVALETVAAV